MCSREPRLVLPEKLLKLLEDILDFVNLSMEALDIVLCVLDLDRVLKAERRDLGGYVDDGYHACRSGKAIHDAARGPRCRGRGGSVETPA